MKRVPHRTTVVRLATALAVCATAIVATAHPYATCLTNNAGEVSFRLNEAADNVKVIGNANTLTNDLGALARGLTVTNLNLSSGMTGGVFRVVVNKAGSGAPILISDNNNTFNQFERPTGVAVNKRPASPYFGRIYVSNARNLSTGTGRPLGDGIYILNADSTDAVGQGNTVLTGGIDFVTGGTSAPWRLRVGDNDDMLYVTDWSDSVGNLWQVDPNVSAGSGTNVFQLEAGPLDGYSGSGLPAGYNHGSVAEVYVTGTLGAGDLKVYSVDEDYETVPTAQAELNSLWHYDILSGPFPWSNAPNAKIATPSTTVASQTMGLDRGTNGYFYLMDLRSDGNQNCLQVIDPTGPTVLYESRTDSMNNQGFPRDILSNCTSVAVSSDMKFLAAQRSAGSVVVVPLVNGIPNLAARIEFVGIGSSARQIAFDAANNLYLVSNVTERMRIYSLGLTTTAVTGSDGTFNLSTPATSVAVTADVDTLSEASAPTTAVFTVVRTSDSLANPLTAVFSMTGTATRGTDYALQTNGVTFTNNSIILPAGVGTNTISLIVSNDTTAELTETAILNITGTAFYSAGSPNSATVAIVDDEAPSADISVVQGSAFEANTNDYIRLRITRRGDTNAPSFTVNLNYAGNAISNVDYIAGGPVTIDPGVVTADFDSFPIDDTLLETNETFLVTVAAGVGYNIGTNSVSATGTIIEDETLAATVLFADNFNGDSSTNWTIRFAAGNGIDDYRINENPNAFPPTPYDYSADGIPPAPHGSDTLGLKLTVNKNDTTGLGGAGLNLYPNGQNFSGNFALRFDMYLLINSGAGTTEYAMFGINHSGNFTNWFRSSGDGIGAGGAVDGLFYQVEADGAALGDYILNTTPVFLSAGVYSPTSVASRAASSLTDIFKSPPWGAPGAPANLQSTTTPGWAQVEVNQIGNVVTLRINNTSIMSYTNNGVFQSGNIMLGYDDAFDSNTGTGAAVIYDNVRVVALGRPLITNIQRAGTNALVDFTWSLDDAPTAFTVQKATAVAGPYAGVAGTTIARVGPGAYRATTPAVESAAFFRIRR